MSKSSPSVAAFLLILATACTSVPPDLPEETSLADEKTTSASPSGEAVWFKEEARQRGLPFRHRSGQQGENFLMPESVIGGGGFFDVDGDGNLDIYLVQAGSLTDPADRVPANRLYKNLGNGRFEDITDGSGSDNDEYGMGLACGDYDNDGDTDLYVTNFGTNALLRNNGDATFTDVTTRARVGDDRWGTSATFLDYDRDGDLDLFVSNYIVWSVETARKCVNSLGETDYCGPLDYDSPEPDILYRNNGDGTFTDVSDASGIGKARGNGLGVVPGDFNSDGWTDLFVANDKSADQLWINRQDGTFVDDALMAGCALGEAGEPRAGMGVTAADVDHDGDLDVMVCNFANETDSFFLNEGGFFTDATAAAGLAIASRPFTRFGTGWADFDNDGYLDLYQANGRLMRGTRFADGLFAEPNLLFRGRPGPRFEEVVPRGGTARILLGASRGAAFGDIDNDGGIDILVGNRDRRVHLLHNVIHDGGHWVKFRVLDENGRDAEGVQVRGRVGKRTIVQDVRTAYSYLACNDPRVHFGLGSVTSIGDVTVRWIDGIEEAFGSFEHGRIVTLRRGEGT